MDGKQPVNLFYPLGKEGRGLDPEGQKTFGGRFLKAAWKVYHNSSDHNCSVFHRGGLIGDLGVHYVHKLLVLVPVAHLKAQRHTLPREHCYHGNTVTTGTRCPEEHSYHGNTGQHRNTLPRHQRLPWEHTTTGTQVNTGTQVTTGTRLSQEHS